MCTNFPMSQGRELQCRRKFKKETRTGSKSYAVDQVSPPVLLQKQSSSSSWHLSWKINSLTKTVPWKSPRVFLACHQETLVGSRGCGMWVLFPIRALSTRPSCSLTFLGLLSQQGDSKVARAYSGRKFPLSRALHREDLSSEDKPYGPKKSTEACSPSGFLLRHSLSQFQPWSPGGWAVHVSLNSLEKYFLMSWGNSNWTWMSLSPGWNLWQSPQYLVLWAFSVPVPKAYSKWLGNVCHTESKQMFTERTSTQIPEKISLMNKKCLRKPSRGVQGVPWPLPVPSVALSKARGRGAASQCCLWSLWGLLGDTPTQIKYSDLSCLS